MDCSFKNAKNSKGLCATPQCSRKATRSYIYMYCEECYAQILDSLDSGLVPTAGLVLEPDPHLDSQTLRESSPT